MPTGVYPRRPPTPAEAEARRVKVAAEKRQWYLDNKEKSDASRSRSRKKIRGERHAFLRALKQEMGCCRCGYNENAVALAFHHTDGTKEMDIGRAVADGWGWQRLVKELLTCDVICFNCHAIIHWDAKEPHD